jgi:hypothetical protein
VTIAAGESAQSIGPLSLVFSSLPALLYHEGPQVNAPQTPVPTKLTCPPPHKQLPWGFLRLKASIKILGEVTPALKVGLGLLGQGMSSTLRSSRGSQPIDPWTPPPGGRVGLKESQRMPGRWKAPQVLRRPRHQGSTSPGPLTRRPMAGGWLLRSGARSQPKTLEERRQPLSEGAKDCW